MENIIKRIVEMDRKAKAITDAARQEKLEAEKEIAGKAAALREEYLERARRRAAINGETERTMAEQRWKKREAQYRRQMEQMQACYDAGFEQLADELVRRVLAEDTPS